MTGITRCGRATQDTLIVTVHTAEWLASKGLFTISCWNHTQWTNCYTMDPCERQEIFSYDLSGSPMVEKYWFPNLIIHRIPIEPAQSRCDVYMITLYVLFQLYSQYPYYKIIEPISLLSPVEKHHGDCQISVWVFFHWMARPCMSSDLSLSQIYQTLIYPHESVL